MARKALLPAAVLTIGLCLGVNTLPARAVGPASVWIQTVDSCKQSLGNSQYEVTSTTGSFRAVVTTPSSQLSSVGQNGNCPIPRGDCVTNQQGCVQVASLPAGDSYKIRELVTPPANSGNPLGYAPCNGGSACQGEYGSVTVSGSGAVTATVTNIYPDGFTKLFPDSSSTYSGAASDPVVIHNFGIGNGSCDGDADADDHLTGSPGAHCGYPENQEASACQPYPWSCGLPATAASRFTLANPSGLTAGVPFAETITAVDSKGSVLTTYTGSQALKWSGGGASPNGKAPTYPASVSFSKGVGTATITLTAAQVTSLTATLGSMTGTVSGLTVNPGTAKGFSLATPAPAAGQAFNEAITAVDAFGNTSAYSGSQPVAWSGPAASPGGNQPVYPSSVSFSNGVGTAAITLYAAQTTSLTAKQSTLTGSSPAFAVASGPPGVLTAATPATQTAGSAFAETLRATDAYGNGLSGSFCIGFSGPALSPSGTAPAYPAAGPCGAGQSNLTFSGGSAAPSLTLYDSQTTSLTAVSGSLSVTTGAFAVNPGAASRLLPANPGTQTAGTAFTEPITALDPWGNGFTGARCVSFSGPARSPSGAAPVYPAAGSCRSGQSSLTFSNGAGSASMVLYAAQQAALTATSGVIAGTSGPFAVAAGPASRLTPANPGAQVAGRAFNETIAAADSWGNTATSYAGTACLVFGGAGASPDGVAPAYPAPGSCQSGQAAVSFSGGSGTAGITLFNVQSVALSVSDGVASGSSTAFTVGPAPASRFAIANPGAPTAGVAFTATISALDPFGNIATAYSGRPGLSGPHSAPNGAAPRYGVPSFSAGVARVAVTLFDAESTVLTATDGSIAGASSGFTVTPAGASALQVANPGAQTAGAAFVATITALDPFGNLASSYNRTPTISGPHAAPNGTAPQYGGVSFSGGVGQANVTLFDAESTALNLSDGSIGGSSGGFTVGSGAATHFSVALPATSPVGQSVTVSVAALDAWGNAVNGDSSTLLVTSSDLLSAGSYPATVNMSGGRAQFGIRFLTAGQQSVSVSGSEGTGSGATIAQ